MIAIYYFVETRRHLKGADAQLAQTYDITRRPSRHHPCIVAVSRMEPTLCIKSCPFHILAWQQC